MMDRKIQYLLGFASLPRIRVVLFSPSSSAVGTDCKLSAFCECIASVWVFVLPFSCYCIRADDTNPLKKQLTLESLLERSAFVLTDPRRINQARTMRVYSSLSLFRLFAFFPTMTVVAFSFRSSSFTGSSTAFRVSTDSDCSSMQQ